MAIRVALHHKTSYHYDRAVALSPHEVRLRPAAHARTPILAYSLTVEPATHFLNWQQDPYGNYIARLVFPEPSNVLEFTVDLIADMTVINPFDFFVEEYAAKFPFAYPRQLRDELSAYLKAEPAEPLQRAWIDAATTELLATPVVTADFLVAINQRLQRDIAYLVRMEPGVQSPEETLQKRSGSCRDSAWLLVQMLRHMGLATRFVSGYLIQLTADIKALDGPSGTAVDFTDLHAWVEAYVPGAGWIGLDPTSGMLTGEGNHATHFSCLRSGRITETIPRPSNCSHCNCDYYWIIFIPNVWNKSGWTCFWACNAYLVWDVGDFRNHLDFTGLDDSKGCLSLLWIRITGKSTRW